MIRPKTVSAHSSVSAIVEVRNASVGMGRFIRTCNLCRLATLAELSALMLRDIFDFLRIIYNFCIMSASLFGKCCDLLRLKSQLLAYSFPTLARHSGIAYHLILVLFY